MNALMSPIRVMAERYMAALNMDSVAEIPGKSQVVVIREREGRTLTHITQSEAEGVALVTANVSQG
jgi:hypothetical protein